MPAQRITMRRIREVLRLKHECKLSYAEIARSLGLAKGSVFNYLARAESAGLTYEVAASLDDAALLALAFLPVGTVCAQVKVTAANPASTYQGTVSLDVTVSGSGFA